MVVKEREVKNRKWVDGKEESGLEEEPRGLDATRGDSRRAAAKLR